MPLFPVYIEVNYGIKVILKLSLIISIVLFDLVVC